MASKLTDQERTSLKNICTKTLSWLSEHDQASEEEYSLKKHEVESVCRPITIRLYNATSSTGLGSGFGRQFPSTGGGGADGTGGGPIIDEVD